ncbi:NfeD family protein [Paenibacillus alvei]|uniref:NfeD family protein n=1 Tax=Paenibacillus alvei TaxID=44250 RepID=UPI001F511A75|nr:nodulation protein NfeD [Paenibacillus alvei]MBG9734128.1 serine protease [Paenibacillus alvei]MBG9744493.1 serine protease [Paenibacillus alvei]MCY9582254.1 nodulation protein NfeD [Paenibacillus alvei]MCY9587056.1 nodulation protein NfeD [Paenibacillus alvei]
MRFLRERPLGLAILALVTIMLLFSSIPFVSAQAKADGRSVHNVVVLPLKGTVNPVMESFLYRALEEAEQLSPEAIIIEMDTPGGELESAGKISQRIITSPVRTIMFVEGNAASAGSYLALSANEIAMTPGSAIGSAALVDRAHNYVDDPKLVAMWVSKMKAVAQKNGRDPIIAQAMADLQGSYEIKELGRTVPSGEVLSLSSEDARKAGYTEYVASNTTDLLKQLKLDQANLVQIEPSISEQIAAFVVHPGIATLLLFLGIAGVAIELFVPGFGVPGILGIAGFGLYFFGHYIAGLAGVETIVLFIIGLILLALELFIPSFGILGILGSLSLITGVVLAANDTGHALLSLGIAFAAALVVVIIVVRIFKHRGIWNKFILRDSLSTDEGYVSNVNHTELVGKTGRALTTLRPSGTALIDDIKYDVVTDGAFVSRDEAIKVVQVEGVRIVVRSLNQD